jgi:hypothetical protein
MSSELLTATAEAAIWARLMGGPAKELTPPAAEYLLSISFSAVDRDRMEYLAERSSEGALTDAEKAEYDGYLHVGNLLAVMQSKSRAVLRQKPGAERIRES